MDWKFTFEVDFDTDPGGEPSAWVDLSDRVRPGVNVAYGTPHGGRCTLLLNNQDRALDPTNPASPHNLMAMRHARLQVTVGATSFPLWRGFVEEWPPLWPTFGQGLISVSLVDATAWLAMIDVDVDFPSQPTHGRVNELLDLAGWPEDLRDIGDGVVQVAPFTQASANVLRVLLDTHDAEAGELYVAPDGKVTFRSRHARFDADPTLNVGVVDGVPWTGVDPDFGGSKIVTVARTEMADGRVFEMVDLDGVSNFGVRGLPIRDLSLPWYEASGLAGWTVFRFGRQNMWLDRLELHANDHLSEVLDVRHGDLVGFNHKAPPGGGEADFQGTVASLRHQVGAGRWVTVLDLEPYFGAGPWFTWDDPSRGWDMGAAWAP